MPKMVNYFILLFYLANIFSSSSSTTYDWTIQPPNYPSINKRLQGYLITPSIPLQGKKYFLPTQCAALCQITAGCVSFNHNSALASCELNFMSHVDVSGTALMDNNGWRYYLISSFAINKVNIR